MKLGVINGLPLLLVPRKPLFSISHLNNKTCFQTLPFYFHFLIIHASFLIYFSHKFASIHLQQLYFPLIFCTPASRTWKNCIFFVYIFCWARINEGVFSIVRFLVMKNQFFAIWVSPKTKVYVHVIVIYVDIVWYLNQIVNFTVSMNFLEIECWTI